MEKRVLFWVPVFFLLFLLELAFFFRMDPAVLFFSGLFLIFELLRKRGTVSERMVCGSIPGLGVLLLSWSQPLLGQFLIAALGLVYIEMRRERHGAWREAALVFFLFLLFANFFVFRGALPSSYGFVFLGTALLTFLIVSVHVRTVLSDADYAHFSMLLLGFLVAQWLLVMQFFPHGYLSLALSSLLFYLVVFRLVRLARAKLPAERYGLEIIGGAALVLIILFSGGIRPR